MKNRPLSNVEIIGIIFLLVLAIGCALYFFVYTPIQSEIASINSQIQEIDLKISESATKLAKMNTMKAELDDIFAENEQPSEIAAYDNYQNVFTQLDGILSTAKNYSLGFSDPQIDKSNGIVRRSVSLSYSVNSYEEAKNILMALEQNHWRCVVESISLSGNAGNSGLLSNIPLNVSASLVFFESTNLTNDTTK